MSSTSGDFVQYKGATINISNLISQSEQLQTENNVLKSRVSDLEKDNGQLKESNCATNLFDAISASFWYNFASPENLLMKCLANSCIFPLMFFGNFWGSQYKETMLEGGWQKLGVWNSKISHCYMILGSFNRFMCWLLGIEWSAYACSLVPGVLKTKFDCEAVESATLSKKLSDTKYTLAQTATANAQLTRTQGKVPRWIK